MRGCLIPSTLMTMVFRCRFRALAISITNVNVDTSMTVSTQMPRSGDGRRLLKGLPGYQQVMTTCRTDRPYGLLQTGHVNDGRVAVTVDTVEHAG